MSYCEILESELQQFQIDLTEPQKASLVTYVEELSRWNKKINLTGLAGAALVRRLVAEPIWIGLQLKADGSLLDIGSGNGSPAIALNAVGCFRECHLIEARSKRAAFLRHLTAALSLKNVEVHHARFEDVALKLAAPDWISLQAVALTPQLLALIRRISRPTTRIVWITSSAVEYAGLEPTQSLTVPITGTRVWIVSGAPSAYPPA
ncbi:MAG TPA: RsmG family class I SAM-dependent methyltransferase [Terriglobia bacterium]